MKVAICNVPIRGKPTDVPPYGMMYIRQALRDVGCEVDFYNFDFLRPSDASIDSIFKNKHYDMVGISAVVSTAYIYTQKIASIVKINCPNAYVVLGGNLAANSEVILRHTEVDFCVIGDGELTIKELVRHLSSWAGQRQDNRLPDIPALMKVKGISFLDHNREFFFTGYRDKIAASDIDWPDYSVLELDGSLSHYFPPAEEWFVANGLEVPENVIGTKSAWLPVARGCISRCTFCHRFEKGYRARPTDQVTDHARMLRDRYGVGLVLMFDESFGADRTSAAEIAEQLWALGLYWGAGSVRAKTLSDDIVRHWYSNGCRMITCGLESGSQDMLDIMEKKGTVEDNVRALKAIHRFGLSTNVMLVLGMPGETEGTIQHTINFLIDTIPYWVNEDRGGIEETAAFYAQALPGTPLYESYREKGLVGSRIANEEAYLRDITNVDALNIRHYLNGTDMPMIVVLLWRDKIFWSVYKYYFEKVLGIRISLLTIFKELMYRNAGRLGLLNFPRSSPLEALLESSRSSQMQNKRWASSRIPFLYLLILNDFTKPLGLVLVTLRAIRRKTRSPIEIFRYSYEYLRWIISGRPGAFRTGHGISLRKTAITKVAIDGSAFALELRKGR
jgi:anaerobic magnesium-protoporphyrin IX monomethyl ester cyclase